MTHHEELKPEYPTTLEFQAAVGVAVDHLRGRGDHSIECLVKAAWVVLGYAASFVPPVPHPVLHAPSAADSAAILEAAAASVYQSDPAKAFVDWRTVVPDPAKAFVDWRMVVRIALELILKLL